MSDDIAIKVDNVSKSFKLPHEKMGSIKGAIVNWRRRNKGYENQHVLKDISFEVKKGEFFGIVGRNGSGKSTLLKLISQIYPPDEGRVTVNGKLTPFIELGVGFNPELTGRENIFLNGALLGFSRKEMELMYDEIVEFAELERFMDQKLKNYSSGMQVRLAFSIAIRAESEILILDEVLAVGDEAFQRKCNEYFDKAKKEKNKTIVLVTHSMDSVRQYCSRAMLIVEGDIKSIGKPDKVASAYSDMFIQEQIEELHKDTDANKKTKKLTDVELTDISIVQNGKRTKAVAFKEDFSIKMEIKSDHNYEGLNMGIHIFDQSGRDMIAFSTKTLGNLSLKKGRSGVEFSVQNILADGNYYVNIAIEENISKKLLLQQHEVTQFTVLGLNKTEYSRHSLTYPTITMSQNQ